MVELSASSVVLPRDLRDQIDDNCPIAAEDFPEPIDIALASRAGPRWPGRRRLAGRSRTWVADALRPNG